MCATRWCAGVAALPGPATRGPCRDAAVRPDDCKWESDEMMTIRTLIITCAVLAASFAATVAPAEARRFHRHHGFHRFHRALHHGHFRHHRR